MDDYNLKSTKSAGITGTQEMDEDKLEDYRRLKLAYCMVENAAEEQNIDITDHQIMSHLYGIKLRDSYLQEKEEQWQELEDIFKKTKKMNTPGFRNYSPMDIIDEVDDAISEYFEHEQESEEETAVGTSMIMSEIGCRDDLDFEGIMDWTVEEFTDEFKEHDEPIYWP